MTQVISPSKIKIAFSATLLVFWIVSMVGLFMLLKLLRVGNPDKLIPVFHRGVARLFNLHTDLQGELCNEGPTLYVSNHVSYLDVFVLGSVLPASFIAKSEVAGWPVFGKLAVLQNTLFFERNSRRARSQIKQMQKHLLNNSNLILFPEGTSTPGTHVAPFRSSLFQAADMPDVQIQPVTVAYTHYRNEPMSQQQRDYYAWYIPMPFLSHFLNGMGLGRATAKLILHKPVLLSSFNSRKACAAYCEQQVRKGLLAALQTDHETIPENYRLAVGLNK